MLPDTRHGRADATHPARMDFSVTFARHFSRLVWLLLHEPTNTDEQKAALRAVNTVSKEGEVTFATEEWRLVVNGAPLPEALTGVQDLAAQLIGHAVAELRFGKGTPPAELLGVARILAAEPVPGDGGAAVQQKLGALGAGQVKVRIRGMDSLMRVTPIGSPTVPDDDLGLPDIVDEEPARPAPGLPGVPEPPSIGRRKSAGATASGIVTDETSGTFLAFAAVHTPSGSVKELLAQLDATKSPNAATRTLDELVTLAENAQRDGIANSVADVFHGIVSREGAAAASPDLKRAYVMAVRRLSKPTILRAVAQLLPHRKDGQRELMEVLTRTGEDGADALIEQLSNAGSLAERRIYFDALLQLNAGVPALIHMLGDARWYVARNAADLLGEMQTAEAEGPLADLLKHDDDRVRRAAATALGKLGTPKAVTALHGALKDTAPQVRLQAAAGLAARRGEKNAGTLLRALDEEPDAEVQIAILQALGKLATPDAVQKLVKAAEPEGRFFKKKPAAYRVAAVQALGEARTSAALAALQTLAKDKEKEVQDAVIRVLIGQQGTPRGG